MLTPFQNKCINRCKEFLKYFLGLDNVIFDEVAGKRESYCMTTINSAGHKIEIYVYSNEAGFYIADSREWWICEEPDYDTDDELIQDFIAMLSREFEALHLNM